MKKILTFLIFGLFLLMLAPPPVFAEYNLATKQDETIFISTEKEVRIGRAMSKEVDKKFKVAEDPLVQKRISDIGHKIAKVCDRKDIRYHFKVVLGEDMEPEARINAFALPGGYLYIFKDLVEKLETDDEIAAVLAHEVGHITAKHSVKRMQGSYGMAALQILIAGSEGDRETKATAFSAVGLLMMAYSREDEFMADKLAVKYMKLAGFDPDGAVKVIDKLIEMQKEGPIREYTSYRSHPYLAERKAVVRNEISGKMGFVDYLNMPE